MAQPDEYNVNFSREVLTSQWNQAFVGVMAFAAIVINFWGFLSLLIAGELVALLLAQNSRVRKVILGRKLLEYKQSVSEAEVALIRSLPTHYQNDFNSVRALSDEIERRALDLKRSNRYSSLDEILEKLAAFRHDYLKMLRARHLLSARNYQQDQARLAMEIQKTERLIAQEKSEQVRQAHLQNLTLLKERQARVGRLDELVRLIDARLQVTKNSLGLIQDEIDSFTNVSGITGMVDNLMTYLKITDEFKDTYEDVLNQTLSDPGGLEDLVKDVPLRGQSFGGGKKQSQ